MEWQPCSVRGCGRFCDLQYNAHLQPWCCLVCSLTHGATHSSKCICAPYEPGHIFYDSESDPGDQLDNSTEAGSTSVGDSSHHGIDAPITNTYARPSCVEADTSEDVSDALTENASLYTRRLRQDDSDWEAYQDSDTDSYASVVSNRRVQTARP